MFVSCEDGGKVRWDEGEVFDLVFGYSGRYMSIDWGIFAAVWQSLAGDCLILAS